jgi:hypothetical protein
MAGVVHRHQELEASVRRSEEQVDSLEDAMEILHHER